jgi:hypothetical protein
VNSLHVAATAQSRHEMRVEAGREPPRARRGRDEVERVGGPAGPLDRGPGGALAELERAPAEAIAQCIDRLVGAEVLGVDVEVTAGDVAGLEESAAALVGVAGQLQQLRLREPLRRCGRRHGGNSRVLHPGSSTPGTPRRPRRSGEACRLACAMAVLSRHRVRVR